MNGFGVCIPRLRSQGRKLSENSAQLLKKVCTPRFTSDMESKQVTEIRELPEDHGFWVIMHW